MGGSGAIDSEREREEEEGKGKGRDIDCGAVVGLISTGVFGAAAEAVFVGGYASAAAPTATTTTACKYRQRETTQIGQENHRRGAGKEESRRRSWR